MIRDRKGLVLFLVMLVVLLTGIFSAIWFFVLRDESRGTDQFSKRLVITMLGEGVAARLSAQIDHKGWDERFYLALGQETGGKVVYFFTEQAYPFMGRDLGGLQTTGRTSWARRDVPSFEGTIEDLPEPLAYRIKLRVKYEGLEQFMTWDKTWSQGFMGRLNVMNDTMATRSFPTDRSDMDRLIDEVKYDSRGNMLANDSLRADVDRLIAEMRAGENHDIVLTP